MGWGGPDAWPIPTPSHLKPHHRPTGQLAAVPSFCLRNTCPCSHFPAPEPDSLAAGWAEAGQAVQRRGLPPPPLALHSAPPRAAPTAFGVPVLTSGESVGAEEQAGGSLKQEEKHCSHPLQSGKKQTRGEEGTHPIITESKQRTMAPRSSCCRDPVHAAPAQCPCCTSTFLFQPRPAQGGQHEPFRREAPGRPVGPGEPQAGVAASLSPGLATTCALASAQNKTSREPLFYHLTVRQRWFILFTQNIRSQRQAPTRCFSAGSSFCHAPWGPQVTLGCPCCVR